MGTGCSRFQRPYGATQIPLPIQVEVQVQVHIYPAVLQCRPVFHCCHQLLQILILSILLVLVRRYRSVAKSFQGRRRLMTNRRGGLARTRIETTLQIVPVPVLVLGQVTVTVTVPVARE